MRVLIVEDEILVALELEAVLEENGLEPVGIAADRASAMRLASGSLDVALVDINLRDGPTGIDIGRRLATDHGVRVIFTSANPMMLGDGVEGTLGYLPKPYHPDQIVAVLRYLDAQPSEADAALMPPPDLRLFQSSGLSA
ncbi:response regulator [Oceaniglobus roseus]|uniref:response regulator n=1 Tax=Oceaniglobus roseus TaxID=1737570 RepID=UPI001C12ACB6|nr:response regulator [Kandeliimicrobium roseum]